MSIDKIMVEYFSQLPAYRRLHEQLIPIIGAIAAGEEGVAVSSRVKTWETVREKALRKGAGDLTQITDVVGFKLIVPSVDQLHKVVSRLRKHTLLRFEPLDRMESSVTRFNEAVHMAVRLERLHGAEITTEDMSVAKLSAEIQVVTQTAHLLSEIERQLHYKADASTKFSDRVATAHSRFSELEDIIREFEVLLDSSGVHEKRDIHPFLAAHDFLLHPNPVEILSEVHIGLGTLFAMDFLIHQADSTYILVEIENPQHRLFTRSGDFTAAVNHAVRQVEDWQEWIEDNLPVVTKTFPGMSSPLGHAVIGRARNLTHGEFRRLARRNINFRGRLSIRTYDDLIENARAYISSMRRNLGEK